MSVVPIRKARLSRSADFDRVYRRGRSSQHRLLVLYCFERPDDVRGTELGNACRFGFTVSKQVGNAVVRNRMKRRLREALSAVDCLHDDRDYVAIARPGLPEAVDRKGFAWLGNLVDELARDLARRAATGNRPGT